MTPETETMKELIEAVEQLNRPEWWSVGATIVAAIVAAVITYVLGKRQNELQEQQIRAQEYEVRKRLYSLLKNANREIDYFLEKLSSTLYETNYNADKEYLQRWQTSLNKLIKDLQDSYDDYELKFSKETFDNKGYLDILLRMSFIIQQTIISLQQGDVCFSRGVHEFGFMSGKKDEALATDIAKHYKGGAFPSIMMGELANFIRLKRAVRCDDSLLDSIRAKCKID